MNAKKDRYAVRISEASYTEMQEQALRDGAKQGIAVELVALEKAFGWRKDSSGTCVRCRGRAAASAADIRA